jgi:DNA replication protein DnaC
MATDNFQSLAQLVGADSATSSTPDGTGRRSPKWEQALAALKAAAELAPEQGEVTHCPLCNDMGAILVEHAEHLGQRYPLYRRCDCVDRPERTGWLKDSGIPPLFQGRDFDSCRALRGVDPKAVDRVEQWAKAGGKDSLLLFGPFGVVKTGMAVAALAERIAGGQRGLFITSADLLGELRASFDHGSGGLRPSEILDAVRKVPLLVIDDLGAEAIPRDAEWLQEVFYRLLGHRHDYLRPVIVTTNLGAESGKPLGEIALRLGERTAWRLTEMIGASGVRVGGENQRKGGR